MNYVAGTEDSIEKARSLLLSQIDSLAASRILYTVATLSICVITAIVMRMMRPVTRCQTLLTATRNNSIDSFGQAVSDIVVYVLFPIFVFLNVILSQWIIEGGKIYDGKYLTAGYILHSSTGSLYYIAAGLQFYLPLRQRYPKIHRYIGYFYYIMVVLTSIGIVMICRKPHSGFSTQVSTFTFLPPWLVCNFLALRAIAVYRDVEVHRQLNILAISLAVGIIFMRPMTFFVKLSQPKWDFGRALSLSIWVVFVWAILGTVMYLIHAYAIPTMRYPRLQHNGDLVITGSIYCPLAGTIMGVVSIMSFKYLDERTIMLKLGRTEKNCESGIFGEKGVHGPAFPINLPPGCHVTLTIGNVTREFTPVRLDSETTDSCDMYIVVRLVRDGQFSNLLKASLGTFLSLKENEWKSCACPCGLYGPLLPLPSKFGYLPHYESEYINDNEECRTIIMIGAGTGVMPYFNIIEAALKIKNDNTIIKLLSLSGTVSADSSNSEGLGGFVEEKIKDLTDLSMKSDSKASNRFIGVNSSSRFQVSMLDDWIREKSKPSSPNDTVLHRSEIDRTIVWVCGPPGFGQSCRSSLVKEKNFRVNQIFILGVDDR